MKIFWVPCAMDTVLLPRTHPQLVEFGGAFDARELAPRGVEAGLGSQVGAGPGGDVLAPLRKGEEGGGRGRGDAHST